MGYWKKHKLVNEVTIAGVYGWKQLCILNNAKKIEDRMKRIDI